MNTKKTIFCLLAFCMVMLSSCGGDDTDYVEKIIGEYDIEVTPVLNVKFGNSVLPIVAETINTTGRINATNDDGNVVVMIDGVNGKIGEISFVGYCDDLGLELENNSYEGYIQTSEYGQVYCNVNLKNPKVSIYNSASLSWESSVTGTCEINISGLDNMTCDVTGKIQFEANEK